MNASQAPTVRPCGTDPLSTLHEAGARYRARVFPDVQPVYAGQPRSLPYLYWGAVLALAALPFLFTLL